MDRKSLLTLFTAMIMAGAAPVLAGEREVAPETTPAATAADTAGYSRFRFGGYGEMVASFKDYGINRFVHRC